MAPPRADPHRNVELKARLDDRERALETCRMVGASDHGEIYQRDTYFYVPRGGLKLREERPGNAHLIQFERAEEPQQRESRYQTVEIADAHATKGALEAALGLRVVVVKRRRLHIWREVRIHLDDVDGLGSFIELEAVAPPQSDLGHEHALILALREQFAIGDERLLALGYAEQLLAKP